MKEILLTLFGTYTPLLNGDGSYVYGVAGVDWPWVLGVVLFGLCLYCLLRMVGGFIR